ncbi:hypothetical protein Glove_709g28 [Diversispora epigaea]|uniref:Uncharacterized protein n=1 Tax=Diversispora epigaea TaxID=1348612 RepID=A0A397G5A6_9GLOM|nr:hypothetical protein Glove_709g28 [Diversispora epigaea]
MNCSSFIPVFVFTTKLNIEKKYGYRDEWDIGNLEFTPQWYNWKELFDVIKEYWDEKAVELTDWRDLEYDIWVKYIAENEETFTVQSSDHQTELYFRNVTSEEK